MSIKAKIASHINEIVEKLQKAGHETYIVGGAVRDGLLDRAPKDYDISTAATPRQICRVFGGRQTFIIGRRFKLVHLHHGREVIEISTFRREPDKTRQNHRSRKEVPPENMIFHDNEFGTSEEDAWRRDFTVNAIFYDPTHDKIIDCTGMGVKDIDDKIVRVIGDPALRFEEDPVRLLRALKLVGQYGFKLEEETKRALSANLDLITHASHSRLTLELEKILKNPYSDKILQAFHEHGFLKFFLPFLESKWDTKSGKYSLALLAEKNKRLREGIYRDSISLALASLVLPFVEESVGQGPSGGLWENYKGIGGDIKEVARKVFEGHSIIKRLTASAMKMMMMQPIFKNGDKSSNILSNRSYAHGRELMIIQNETKWKVPGLIEQWPNSSTHSRPERQKRKKYDKRRPKNKLT